MDLAKRKSLIKASITFQFNYCSLTWMFHSRQLNNGINQIHERTLRLVYKDNNKLNFHELLALDNSAKPSDNFNKNVQGKKKVYHLK